jgi:hypothetical protein
MWGNVAESVWGDDYGGSGGGNTLIAFYILFLALAWLGGREWSMFAYIPPLIGTPVVAVAFYIFTGKEPRSWFGTIFIGHLLGFILIWWWANRENSPPSKHLENQNSQGDQVSSQPRKTDAKGRRVSTISSVSNPSGITGFERSHGAANAVLANYIFETIDNRLKKRVADEALQIAGSLWKHYDRSEIAGQFGKEPRVVQCNFLALAFVKLGVRALGGRDWWQVNNPGTLSEITDAYLTTVAEVIGREANLSIRWPGNANNINFASVHSATSRPQHFAPCTSNEQQAYESREGRCPNLSCGWVMPMHSDECPRCGAIFDQRDSSLQLIPLPVTMPNS